ncbi:MAG: DUF357 domain-containing protein [Candidatus Altiarchaeota archaeon]
MKSESEIKAKLEKYFKNAEKLFDGVRVDDSTRIDVKRAGEGILESASNYYSDAMHFYENGEYFNALAALEYAEGWLDAGKSIGLLTKD